jgi:ABC-type branched-subunit amino acid transport system substrate-binding protein
MLFYSDVNYKIKRFEMKKHMKYLGFICFFITIFLTQYVQAEQDIITFGQTGPASALGIGMNDGIMAAFKEANDAGGIKGQKLKLIVYDDGYEPDKAIENTKKLIETDSVFALIGGVGTPTANAIEPITTINKVPFIGPFTGAEFLRNPSSVTLSIYAVLIGKKQKSGLSV